MTCCPFRPLSFDGALVGRRWVRSLSTPEYMARFACLLSRSQLSNGGSSKQLWIFGHIMCFLCTFNSIWSKKFWAFSYELDILPVDIKLLVGQSITLHSIHSFLCTWYYCSCIYLQGIQIHRHAWCLLYLVHEPARSTRWSPVFCRSAPLPAGSLFRVSAGAI